ncbi:MAG: HAAS signaling domain-containing protein, partial [Acidimicrobiia bacterium]
MSITLSPSKAAYLDRVAEGLADLSDEDREEVVQDLEAHLAELEDEEVESTLGSPEAFVSEFRQSAGLSQVDRRWRSPGLIARSRARLEEWESRLSERTRWQSIRPLWIWV